MAKTPQNNLNNVTQTLQEENIGQNSVRGILESILENLTKPSGLRSPRARIEQKKDLQEDRKDERREKERDKLFKSMKQSLSKIKDASSKGIRGAGERGGTFISTLSKGLVEDIASPIQGALSSVTGVLDLPGIRSLVEAGKAAGKDSFLTKPLGMPGIFKKKKEEKKEDQEEEERDKKIWSTEDWSKQTATLMVPLVEDVRNILGLMKKQFETGAEKRERLTEEKLRKKRELRRKGGKGGAAAAAAAGLPPDEDMVPDIVEDAAAFTAANIVTKGGFWRGLLKFGKIGAALTGIPLLAKSLLVKGAGIPGMRNIGLFKQSKSAIAAAEAAKRLKDAKAAQAALKATQAAAKVTSLASGGMHAVSGPGLLARLNPLRQTGAIALEGATKTKNIAKIAQLGKDISKIKNVMTGVKAGMAAAAPLRIGAAILSAGTTEAVAGSLMWAIESNLASAVAGGIHTGARVTEQQKVKDPSGKEYARTIDKATGMVISDPFYDKLNDDGTQPTTKFDEDKNKALNSARRRLQVNEGHIIQALAIAVSAHKEGEDTIANGALEQAKNLMIERAKIASGSGVEDRLEMEGLIEMSPEGETMMRDLLSQADEMVWGIELMDQDYVDDTIDQLNAIQKGEFAVLMDPGDTISRRNLTSGALEASTEKAYRMREQRHQDLMTYTQEAKQLGLKPGFSDEELEQAKKLRKTIITSWFGGGTDQPQIKPNTERSNQLAGSMAENNTLNGNGAQVTVTTVNAPSTNAPTSINATTVNAGSQNEHPSFSAERRQQARAEIM